MKRHQLLHQIAASTALLAVSACYRQIPIGMKVPESQARIVADLTDLGAEKLAQTIGVGATHVEGIVVAADDSTWQLQMVRVDQRGGASTRWNHELVRFPRSALTGVSVKQLDKKTSWLFAGAATVTAFLLERILTGAFSGGDTGKGPTDPPAS